MLTFAIAVSDSPILSMTALASASLRPLAMADKPSEPGRLVSHSRKARLNALTYFFYAEDPWIAHTTLLT